MAKAAKLGFRISKLWGECRYDVIVETGGRFMRIQVKSTICRRRKGYNCRVQPSDTSEPYHPGEFDFLAVYIITEDVWYIVPARVVVHKLGRIRLHPSDPACKYAPYKEAWHLLR